ncbi:MAG TPA: hypothetical protein VKE71_04120 [Candidatus Angelobacter sp.]|nr:hypothetical protein [Candidatus Angelobacter sp.]
MNSKTLLVIIIGVTLSGIGFAQAVSSDDQAATRKLGAFVGKWRSEATRLETAYSHADKISSNIDCRWSPQENFLICEQQISDSSGNHTQLSIYSYNSTEKNYTISSMAGPGKQPWNGTLVINGSIWTYPGGFEANGKKVTIRTTNDFSVPGTETFKSEFSEDGGVHWTVMLQGTAHKISN